MVQRPNSIISRKHFPIERIFFEGAQIGFCFLIFQSPFAFFIRKRRIVESQGDHKKGCFVVSFIHPSIYPEDDAILPFSVLEASSQKGNKFSCELLPVMIHQGPSSNIINSQIKVAFLGRCTAKVSRLLRFLLYKFFHKLICSGVSVGDLGPGCK